MSLRQKQSLFAKKVGELILKAYEMGYEVTLGDAYRDPRVHGDLGVRKSYSHPSSAHKVRLAIDLNLFKDGEFLEGSDAHRAIAMQNEGLLEDFRRVLPDFSPEDNVGSPYCVRRYVVDQRLGGTQKLSVTESCL